MKRLLLVTTLAVMSLAAAPPKGFPPAVGQVAPEFAAGDQNGARVSLSSARGRKVVLVFYRGYW